MTIDVSTKPMLNFVMEESFIEILYSMSYCTIRMSLKCHIAKCLYAIGLHISIWFIKYICIEKYVLSLNIIQVMLSRLL